MKKKRLALILGSLSLLGAVLPAPAQWVSQSIGLKAGWNAVYLHVDASYDSLANLVGANSNNPIIEVWMWAPSPSTVQFVQSPLDPTTGNSQWMNWNRTNNAASPLQNLVGNAAYLVKVATNVATYTWTVKGKPLAPSYGWTTLGVNFLGFPTVTNNAPTFENFLAKCPELQLNAEIFYYPGGELGVGNPLRLYTARTTKVNRGQAYWIRSGTYFNRYFAPFEVVVSDSDGLNYGDTFNACSFRLRNLTTSNLTVTLQLAASETPPGGQASIAGPPPLLVRGAMNTTNLTYAYSALPLGGTRTWTLAAKGASGSEVEVVLGLNRAAMADPVGSLRAAVLRLTDSLGYSQVEFPVSATMASSAGLWIGAAAVTQVGQYIKSYALDSADALLVGTNGQYVAQGTNTSLGAVPSTFPLRLIVHNPASGNATLLQRIYVGVDAETNAVVARQESELNHSFLGVSRRISAAHLPWTKANTPWSLDGSLGGSTQLTTIVTLDYADQESNPFLHTYHPDHDNLDATFKNELARGKESYTIERLVTLAVTPPAADASDFEAGERTLKGTYAESITVLGLARAAQAGEAMTTAAYTNQLAQYNAYTAYTNQYTTYTNQLVTYPAYTNYVAKRSRGVNGAWKLFVSTHNTSPDFFNISNWSLLVDTWDSVSLATNTTPFTSMDYISSVPWYGDANPYPSLNSVTGITNHVIGVRIRLEFANSDLSDLDVLLVGPSNNVTYVMSDCGGTNVSSDILTFSDAATLTYSNGFVSGGTYRPYNVDSTESAPGDAIGPILTNLNALLLPAPVVVANPGIPGSAPTPVPWVAKPWRSERTYEVRGIFSLTRVSDVPLLK
jgi:hypothetical protein